MYESSTEYEHLTFFGFWLEILVGKRWLTPPEAWMKQFITSRWGALTGENGGRGLEVPFDSRRSWLVGWLVEFF